MEVFLKHLSPLPSPMADSAAKSAKASLVGRTVTAAMTAAAVAALVALMAVAFTPRTAAAQSQPKPPSAQRRELVGIVRDPAGLPIEGAAIEIPGASTRSNAKGLFQLFTGSIDTVTIVVRRLGFTAIEAQLTARDRQWDTVVVELEPTAQNLKEVTVKAAPGERERWMADFEDRRARGLGVFVSRKEIAERNTTRLSDVLRDRRGINVVRLSTQRYGVRFSSQSVGARGTVCAPDVWIDGARARGMEVDDIMASTVEAVELYDTFSTVPMQFSHQANSIPCGTIVIWTRLPSRPDREEPRRPR